MSAIKPISFDKYLLLDRIAVGGMAEVYRGKLIGEKGFEKPVVLKKMHSHLTDEKEMVDLFIDEARLAAQLKHENIIHIYDFGNKSGTLYIAMEYLFGKDLHQVINKKNEKNISLQLENILYIIMKVAEGLGYAHNLKDLQGNKLNIIHRDVSPQNIFITYDGQVKLIDFGIAKAATKVTKTQAGIIKGKVAYMSPEQASGRTIDYRSDIFSVGIILYELVTGKKMFEGDTFHVLAQVIEAKYDPPEKIVGNIPMALCDIIEKALRSDPSTRYQSCEEMAADLENLLYDLKYRPNTKKLSSFMRTLYCDCFDQEKQEMADRMGCKLETGEGAQSSPAGAGHTEVFDTKHYQSLKSDDTPSVTGSENRIYESTEVINTDTHSLDEQKTSVSVHRPVKKRFFYVVIILLLSMGVIGGSFYKKVQKKNDHISYLLVEAGKKFEQERVIFPKGNCSIDYYQEVLSIDPDNKQALRGKSKAVNYCIQKVQYNIRIFNVSSARDYVLACIKIDPENRQLRDLEKETSSNKKVILHNVKELFIK